MSVDLFNPTDLLASPRIGSMPVGCRGAGVTHFRQTQVKNDVDSKEDIQNWCLRIPNHF